MAFKIITEDELYEKFPMIDNPTKRGAGELFDDSCPKVREFLAAQDPNSIWTMAEDSEGGTIIMSGWHYVNRIAYLVSTVPVPDGDSYEIELSSSEDRDEEGCFIE